MTTIELNCTEIRQRRVDHGLTQAEAARAAGMSGRSLWCDLEFDRRKNITLKTLARVADVLHCTAADLLITTHRRNRRR